MENCLAAVCAVLLRAAAMPLTASERESIESFLRLHEAHERDQRDRLFRQSQSQRVSVALQADEDDNAAAAADGDERHTTPQKRRESQPLREDTGVPTRSVRQRVDGGDEQQRPPTAAALQSQATVIDSESVAPSQSGQMAHSRASTSPIIGVAILATRSPPPRVVHTPEPPRDSQPTLSPGQRAQLTSALALAFPASKTSLPSAIVEFTRAIRIVAYASKFTDANASAAVAIGRLHAKASFDRLLTCVKAALPGS
jgi:hypothetical protein